MAFNKKRACCCDDPVPGSDDFYFEVKPKIPIAASEKSQSSTYSFWLEVKNVDTLDGVPLDSTVIFEHFPTNYASEVGFDVTLLIWKSLNDGLVFVPRLYQGGTFPAVDIYHTDGFGYSILSEVQVNALRFRGFYMDANPRLLSEDDWDDLDETKILLRLPSTSEEVGLNKFNTYKNHGYFFGNNQFDQSPAIGPETFGNLTWEMYPKVNANMPVVVRALKSGVGDSLEFFDFSALFPSTLSVEVSGSAPVIYRRSGIETANNSVVEDSIPLSKTLIYTKTRVDEVGATTIQYELDDAQNTYLNDSPKTVQWEVEVSFPPDSPPLEYSVDLYFAVPFKAITMFYGSFGGYRDLNVTRILKSTVAGCANDIGYDQDAPGWACQGCNPDATTTQRPCTGGNYSGSYLKDKQWAHSFDASPKVSDGSVDVDDFSNYPTGIGYESRRISGIDGCPVLVWGAATGEEVELEIKSPSQPGFPSLKVAGSPGSCHPYDGSPSQFVYHNVGNFSAGVPVLGAGQAGGSSEYIYGRTVSNNLTYWHGGVGLEIQTT